MHLCFWAIAHRFWHVLQHGMPILAIRSHMPTQHGCRMCMKTFSIMPGYSLVTHASPCGLSVLMYLDPSRDDQQASQTCSQQPFNSHKLYYIYTKRHPQHSGQQTPGHQQTPTAGLLSPWNTHIRTPPQPSWPQEQHTRTLWSLLADSSGGNGLDASPAAGRACSSWFTGGHALAHAADVVSEGCEAQGKLF
jgi:hypothetical protein